MAYIRKVRLKEWFHHASGTTYDSSSTEQLIGSTADDWTETYALNVGKVSGPTTAVANYLTNYTPHTVDKYQVYECSFTPTAGLDESTSNSDQGVGWIFRANDKANAYTHAYRLRQNDTALYLEKTVDSGVNWTELGKYAQTAVVDTKYYYRVLFADSAMTVYGTATNLTAGKFMVYRTTTKGVYGRKLVNSSGSGTEVDGSPLTAGGYMGPFVGETDGSAVQPDMDVWNFAAYKMFEADVQGVKVKDRFSEVSKFTVAFSRNPDTLAGTWMTTSDSTIYDVGDRIEGIGIEDDRTNGNEVETVIFDGRVEVLPTMSRNVIICEGWTTELANMHWQDSTALTGAVTTELATQLADDGGIIGGTAGTESKTYVLHDLNIAAIATTTERVVQASNSLITFNQLCQEINYWHSFRPDGRFLVQKDMENTQVHTISNQDDKLNFLEFFALFDGKQIINATSEYYNRWATPGSTTDATSKSDYGVRNNVHADMFIQGSTVSGQVGANIISNQKDKLRMVRLQLMQQGLDIFPGDRVDVIIAGTELGTNDYNTNTATWVSARMTCTEKDYNSLTGIVSIVLTRADDASDTAYHTKWPSGKNDLGFSRTNKNQYALGV